MGSDVGPSPSGEAGAPRRGAGPDSPGDGFEVRDSGIHGRGLFATRPFQPDQRIGEALGSATRRNGAHVLWYEDERGVERALRIRNDLRFANHARPGNAAFHGLELRARVPITAGEEITVDYGPTW